ncbi:MAG: hypothetical protein U0V64_14735 [Cyclobacteriaceae bacterium]
MEDAFRRKLHHDNKPRAIAQLIRNIKNILNKSFPVDQNYKSKDVYIYPLVILHDHQYDVIGLNNIVNDWFLQEVAGLKSEGFPTERIQPLVIINIDTLIFHQDILRDNLVRLEDIIDAYNKRAYAKPKKRYQNQEDYYDDMKNKLIPFGNFFTSIVAEKRLNRIPSMLKAKGYTLFQ